MSAHTLSVPTIGRSLEQVCDLHSLSRDEFQDKLVVDLGSAYHDLGAELAAAGIAARVILLDRAHLPKNIDESMGERRVYGQIEHLPLADGTADIALASWSVPFWAADAEAVASGFQEMRRIVTIGGLLSVAPIAIHAQGAAHYEEIAQCRIARTTELDRQVQDLRESPAWEVTSAKNHIALNAIRRL